MVAEPSSGSRDVAAIELLVADWGRRLAQRWSLARAAASLAALLLLPLCAVIVDHFWPGGLPRSAMRGAGLGWAGCVLLAAAGLLIAGRLRRANPIFAGQQLERALDVPHNALVNTLALHRAAGGAYALDSAARQATRALQRVSHWPTPPAALGTRLRLALLFVLTAWLLYGALAPKSIWQSLLRFFGFDLAPPTATRIELVRPAAGEVARAGESLEIEFAVSGRAVDDVLMTLTDGTPRTLHLGRRSDEGRASRWSAVQAPHEVTRDIAFICRAGDAALSGVIAVAPRPEIVSLKITLRPPSGSGEVVSTTDRDLAVWRGTQATFELRTNTALRDPVFVFRGASDDAATDESTEGIPAAAAPADDRTRMSVDAADPHEARATIVLDESGGYRIEFSDRWNTPYRDPHWYRIALREGAVQADDQAAPEARADDQNPERERAAGGGKDTPSGDQPSSADEPNPDRERRNGGSSSSQPAGDGQTGHPGDGPGQSAGESGAGGERATAAAGDAAGENGAAPGGDAGNGSGQRGEAPPGDDGRGSARENGERESNGQSGARDVPNGGANGDSPAAPGASRGAGRRDGAAAPDTMPPDDPRANGAPPRPGDSGSGVPGAALNPGVGRSPIANLHDLLARGQTIPESALLDTGLSPEAARSFAGALRRVQEAARRFGIQPAPRAISAVGRDGDTNAQAGRGLAGDAQRAVGEGDESLRAALSRITPPPNQIVPPQLRAVLEAYYRSLAARRGESIDHGQ